MWCTCYTDAIADSHSDTGTISYAGTNSNTITNANPNPNTGRRTGRHGNSSGNSADGKYRYLPDATVIAWEWSGWRF
jgi:hypothetical protein